MLAQLQDLKDRLGVTDGGQDGDLSSILEASSDKVLAVCRYSELDATGIVEALREVQQGREYRTKLRRVNALPTDGTMPTSGFKVEGRGHGNAFAQLSVDLIDADDGVWTILGAAEWWPPNYAEERRPSFRRWRQPIWPVVRVTYDVTGINDSELAPAALREATLTLAVYWLGQSKAGAVSDVTIGQLSQTISDEPMPHSVRSLLGGHYQAAGATWVR